MTQFPSVWASAQSAPATQRKNAYVPGSTAHPAKMLPAIARHAIAAYTHPGDTVLDPMCGIGTTLVEAVHQGHDALGVEYEPRWASIAQSNLDLARRTGATGTGQVLTADARRLTDVVPADLHGRVALIVTSPPYGASVHGQVSTLPGRGVHKRDHTYGHPLDRHNLANLDLRRLLTGFTAILTACASLLRPGGHIVITIRPYRDHGELVDLPTHILQCGIDAGLTPVERCVALLARVDDDNLVARGSFFQRDFVRKHRDNGLPVSLIVHEDVVVLQALPGCAKESADRPPRAHRAVEQTHRPLPTTSPQRAAG
ncbi:TRM11 family SAM-dependent methyltransferase [Phytoactinopolyspora endophytica]|uniref:TRM11 family SAM-dependent methyltransferase n=1 Tax=Phytoactinopolyspora endophytica TaxID=1642495 RepID=UPI00101CFED0|nr:DNA methyltransferase [Phytoactinopolyspora endophytica]